MNNNGLYLAHKTDDGVQAVHIDEEVLWFARLNRLTRGRREVTAEDEEQVGQLCGILRERWKEDTQ